MKAMELAVLRPLFSFFDYLVPATGRRGARARVQFGNSEELALIWRESGSGSAPDKLKAILELWDAEPLLPEDLLELLAFAGRYYHYPLGAVLENALPPYVRRHKELPPPPKITVPEIEEVQLTAAQGEALAALRPHLAGFQVTLLEGLTGSGKSELYAQAFKELRRGDGQLLLLVPEIGLTNLLLAIVEKRLGLRGAVYHSQLPPKRRGQVWNGCRLGAIDFIVGTRSAVFLPFKNLQLIVVDEEHDLSFKQQEQLRYHCRDLAIWRGQRLNLPVILGSATPSLEALHKVKEGRWHCVRLLSRARSQQPPQLVLDDLREGKVGHLSLALIRAMRQTLDRGQQVLLFLNRRGYGRSLACKDCDYEGECPNCSALLVVHRRRNLLRCHHCGHCEALPPRCPRCQGVNLIFKGLGTERLEEELAQQFPRARLLRIDSDSFSTAKQFQAALELVRNHQVDILIGTQWLAKGHHFPHLQMVAVVDADSAFFGSDYRSEERLAQLLLQVGGRAGREQNQGLIWVQTRQPRHPIFAIFQRDYRDTAWRLYENRRLAQLPPFSHQVLLTVQHRDENEALAVLQDLKERNLAPQLQWLGPVPAGLARRAGYYRAQLLLQSSDRLTLQRVLPAIRSTLQELAKQRRALAQLDVDPLVID